MKPPSARAVVDDVVVDPLAALHIKDFYRGANVFISGGSGYLGKVIVEKLLRTCTGVRRIYLLMRPKRGVAPAERLRQMLLADVFSVLRDTQPAAFKKLHCMQGDIAEERLGLSDADAQRFRDEVNIVVHSAATIRFTEPMRVAMNLNVLGTKRLLDLCGECADMRSIVHISTAYVNGNLPTVEERVYAPDIPIDIDWLIDNLVEWPDELALKIAAHVQGPFENSYVPTKRIAEQLIEQRYAHLPVCIVRPSIIMPTYREPFSGWLDMVFGPIFGVLCAMTGALKYFVVDRKITIDIVPLDYVSNAVLAAAWYSNTTAAIERPPKTVRVFNCTSGRLKPAIMGAVTDTSVAYCRQYPSARTMFYPDLDYSENWLRVVCLAAVYHIGPALLQDSVRRLSGRGGKSLRQLRVAHDMTLLNRYFVNHEWSFAIDNYLHLLDTCARTADGASDFNCDVRNVDYEAYAAICVKGTRKYIMKDSDSTLNAARVHLKWLYALRIVNRVIQGAAVMSTFLYVLRRFDWVSF